MVIRRRRASWCVVLDRVAVRVEEEDLWKYGRSMAIQNDAHRVGLVPGVMEPGGGKLDDHTVEISAAEGELRFGGVDDLVLSEGGHGLFIRVNMPSTAGKPGATGPERRSLHDGKPEDPAVEIHRSGKIGPTDRNRTQDDIGHAIQPG